MIRYFTRKENFLAIARAYLQIYQTPVIQADPAEKDKYLKLVVLYVILSQYDSEQADLAARVFAFKHLTDLPNFKRMLKYFITVELLSLDKFKEIHGKDLQELDVISEGVSALSYFNITFES